MASTISQKQETGAFTIVSGMIGSVGKAITAKPLTLPGLSTVIIYAAASAAAG